ncbi:GerAB/ArcD/ProY family transporter [Gottfriedia sp. NPDC057991]|uniref:GerAB/ArcD/ProY family transporter n=1 Tax=Gottfriedia sp. NPDC057991 TaxID=3346298 RepID=UPI0036DA65C4
MGLVNNMQIFFIIMFSLVSLSFISMPGDAVKAAGTGAWFAICIVAILFSFGVFIIASLSKMFEGKTIHEYSILLVGKFMAKIIGFIYTIYFVFLSIILFTQSVNFIKQTSLPLTPIWTILLIFIVVTFYTVYKGLTTIGRLFGIYGFLFVFIPLATHIGEFLVGDIDYIKPFFEPKLVKEYVLGAKDLIPAFIGIEILTIIPFGQNNLKRGVLFSMISVLYVGVYYAFAAETSVMILGINQIVLYKASLVEALRETKLPEVFFIVRFDIAFLIIGTICLSSGLMTTSFAAVENTVKLFSRIKRNFLLVVVGIIIYISCLFLDNSQPVTYLFLKILPIGGIITGFIIPILLFIVAKVKKYES